MATHAARVLGISKVCTHFFLVSVLLLLHTVSAPWPAQQFILFESSALQACPGPSNLPPYRDECALFWERGCVSVELAGPR